MRTWWHNADEAGSLWRRRWRYLWPFVRKFGPANGLRLAKQLAEVEWRSGEPRVAVSVPGWKAPVWLRPGSTDSWVFRQQVLGGELELDIRPAPRRIIDGGANIGLASLVFANRWPDVVVVAVELEARNVEVLRENCASLSNIHVVHAAIWGTSGLVSVSGEQAGECGYRVDGDHPSPDIRAVTIGALADEQGWDTIDLVKLDIEGAEREVLSSAGQWLHRVSCLVIELHERFAPGCQAAFDAVIKPDVWDIREHGEYLIACRRAPAGAMVRGG